ncbi:MAG: SDR family NAD(P)-dependent oxidoreductase [Bacteroidales bacterium]|jgi:short-subunit dehydrogenase|nr:SDR family NAD(P)-dependent oxidoreductase [Bacteroidales bacterium]
MKKIRNAIVIGATSGIGRKVAELLANDVIGKVGITGRRLERLEELKSEKPNKYIVKSFDITDLQTTVEQLQEFVVEMETVDLILLCSGIGKVNHELDFDIEQKTIMTNVLGFTNIIDWSFNFFDKQGYGHLAAISSIASLRGNRYAPSYFASKAYNKSYLEAMRGKANKTKSKIKITDIRPGFVDTDLIKDEGNYIFFVSPLNKAARQIYKAIRCQKKVVYVTRRWYLAAFIMKIAPKFIYDRI